MLDTPLTLSQIILFGFFAYIGYNIYTTLVEFNNRVKKIAEFTESINRLMQLQVPHNLNNNLNIHNNDNQNWWSVMSSYLAQNPDMSNNLINVYVNAIRGWVDLLRGYFQNNTGTDHHNIPNLDFNEPEVFRRYTGNKFTTNAANANRLSRKKNLYRNFSMECPLNDKNNVQKHGSVLCDLIIDSESEQHNDSDKDSVCSLRINDIDTITAAKLVMKNSKEAQKCSDEPIQVNI